eukprot:1712380-Rhodomonas_salina.2
MSGTNIGYSPIHMLCNVRYQHTACCYQTAVVHMAGADTTDEAERKMGLSGTAVGNEELRLNGAQTLNSSVEYGAAFDLHNTVIGLLPSFLPFLARNRMQVPALSGTRSTAISEHR